MTHDDAVALIRGGVSDQAAATWADLGCGDGTFTLALADLLPHDGVVHAIDVEASALRRIPQAHAGTSMVTHVGDFTRQPWPFSRLDGVLMANSLHYVRDQAAFIRACAPAMNPPRRFLIVEYDTNRANAWVPYPLERVALERLFNEAGYSVSVLGSRPSIFRRAAIYAALAVEDSKRLSA